MKDEIKVSYSKDFGQYNDKTHDEILIDFTYGFKIYDEDGSGDNHIGNQSPALGFWGEVYHAYIDLIDSKAKKSFSNDKPYRTKEEDYVHVEKLGQVIDSLQTADENNKEAKRPTYSSASESYKAKSVTSTEQLIIK